MSLEELTRKKYGENFEVVDDIEDLDLTNIGSIQHLDELDKKYLEQFIIVKRLVMSNIGLQSLTNWPSIPSLENLDLSYNALSNGVQNIVFNTPNIRSLSLQGNKFTDTESFKCLKVLKKLEVLNVENNPLATIENYRSQIFKEVPNLNLVDGFDENGNEYLDSYDGSNYEEEDCWSNEKEREKTVSEGSSIVAKLGASDSEIE